MRVPGMVQDPGALIDSNVAIPSSAGDIRGYLVMPRVGAGRGIVVVHEAFGLNNHIRDLARRFAALGYVAIAPDLYAAMAPFDPDDRLAALTAMVTLADADAIAYLEAAAAAVRREAGPDAPVGCIGFCSGGRQSLLVACTSGAFDAAVDCWGGWITRATADAERTRARPRPVIELVGELRVPLYVAVGAEDANPSPQQADEIRRRAASSGQPVTTRVFEDAGHAFLADYRETYREGPAFALWEDVTAFLDKHLQRRSAPAT